MSVVKPLPMVPASWSLNSAELSQQLERFYRLDWDRDTQQLSIGVSDHKYEPALDGLAYALRLGEQARA
jgi:hypothetical protein